MQRDSLLLQGGFYLLPVNACMHRCMQRAAMAPTICIVRACACTGRAAMAIAGGLLSICQGSARRGVGDKEF